MGYAFMRIEKVKSMAALGGKYQHNYRTREVINADKDLSHHNEELVSLHGKTYGEVVKKKIKEMKQYQKVPIRSNGVQALEIVMSLPRDDMERVDIEKWKQDNVEWLQKTFNKNPEEFGDNVISVVYHGDEAGSVHLHAIVTPIDENGKFNCSAYFKGKYELSRLQTSYGKLMEKNHGLQRGVEGSIAKHEDIARLYTLLNRNIDVGDIPKKEMEETQEHFQKRLEDFFKDVRAMYFKKELEKKNELTRQTSLYLNEKKKNELLADELSLMQRESENYRKIVKYIGGGNEKRLEDEIQMLKKLEVCLEQNNQKQYVLNEIKDCVSWTNNHFAEDKFDTELIYEHNNKDEKEREKQIQEILF